MRKVTAWLIVVLNFLFLSTLPASAQMMQGVSVTPGLSSQDLQDIQTGKDLYTKFQNKEISCVSLKDEDFEKIGEYAMNQRIGDSNAHLEMNERIEQMMGTQGEERMHIAIGKNITGCAVNNQKGGVWPMMGWYGNSMTGWGYGFGILWIIGYVVVIVDLILLGMWLWKKIEKK